MENKDYIIIGLILLVVGIVAFFATYLILNDNNNENNMNNNTTDEITNSDTSNLKNSFTKVTPSKKSTPPGKKIWSGQLGDWIYEEDLGNGNIRQYDTQGNLIGSTIPGDKVKDTHGPHD